MIVIIVLVEIWKGHLPNISCAPVCVRFTLFAIATLPFSVNYSFDRLVLPEFLSYFLLRIPERYETFLIVPKVAKYD